MANVKQKSIITFKDPAFPEQLKDLLSHTGRVKVQGIGVFQLKRFPARTAYNVVKQKYYERPSYVKIVFRPSIPFKESMQNYGA